MDVCPQCSPLFFKRRLFLLGLFFPVVAVVSSHSRVQTTTTTLLPIAFLPSRKDTTSSFLRRSSRNHRDFFVRRKWSAASSEEGSSSSSSLLDSPSAQRNKGPIWDVLSTNVLPSLLPPLPRSSSDDNNDDKRRTVRILEVAAGCGIHTSHFATQLVQSGYGAGRVRYYPTDPIPESRSSIKGYMKQCPEEVRDVVAPPVSLMVGSNGILEGDEGPIFDVVGGERIMDLVICINMIHISPWSATVGLMKVSSEMLRKGGMLFCYGPFKVGGMAVESILRLDRSLRAQYAPWGVRDLEEVTKIAEENGLTLVQTVDMPGNTLSIIYKKE